MESNMYPEVTFETKCYENDWKFLLKTNYLDTMIQNCRFPFTRKHLIINNVKDRSRVEQYAKKKIQAGIIDAYYFAEDYADEVLDTYNIQKESFGKGYYYSISELAGIFLTQTKYLLHFSSDAIMDTGQSSQWIYDACQKMDGNPRYIIATPAWNRKYNDAQRESAGRDGSFYIAQGFSDQCYLIRADDFKKDIYNFKHPYSERYPKYGGELFEKRVDSYMRRQNLLRLISADTSYIHYNFPKRYHFIVHLLIRFNLFHLFKIKKAKIR